MQQVSLNNGYFEGLGVSNESVYYNGDITVLTEFHKWDETKQDFVLDEEKKTVYNSEHYIELRKELYNLSDYVGALMKQFEYDRLNGKALIQEMDDCLGHIQSVKKQISKPE